MRLFIKYPLVAFFFLMLLPTCMYGSDFGQFYAAGADTVTVNVLGTSMDSKFEPAVVNVAPGDVIKFVVKEGVHTVTAYHPDNRRDLAIPPGAESFDSGILSAGSEWYLTITHEGEYNYFCMPHERLGHIGKIVSQSPLSHLK